MRRRIEPPGVVVQAQRGDHALGEVSLCRRSERPVQEGCVDLGGRRDELAERLAAIPDEQGRPIGTVVYKPEVVYQQVTGIAPDLIVHFGDLYWRSVGTVGGDEGIQTFENDTGPDDANHAQEGLYVLAGPGIPAGTEDRHLLDVAPTVLGLLGIQVPGSMRGSSMLAGDP